MIAALDVGYFDGAAAGDNGAPTDGDAAFAVAAAVVFKDWTDPAPTAETRVRVAPVASYEPGSFYKRELPCLLRVLDALTTPPRTIVVDGHAWLSDGVPGLGAHLHRALDGRAAVVGVAKGSFRGSPDAAPVLRGQSRQALYVTAVGLDISDAVGALQAMHGPFRIPTLLKRVDALSRDPAFTEDQPTDGQIR
ncbi:MAG: endonuclease V [Acidobacteriota bacterium]